MKTKKLTALILVMAMLLMPTSGAIFAQEDIKVTINGVMQQYDQMPVMVNDRVLVPMRGIFESLGAQIAWDDATETVTGTLGQTTIVLKIGESAATVNGNSVALDVPAQLINSRTMVPVRFVSEALGAKVDWDDANQTVVITAANSGEITKITFDNLTEWVAEKDFQIGGNYTNSKVVLSTAQDHTTGSGKSIEMGGRKSTSDRMKLMGLLDDSMVGKQFTVKGWILSPDGEVNVRIGTYGAKGSEYASSALESTSFTAKKGEWTQFTFSFTHSNAIANMIGIDQTAGAGVMAALYVDDIVLLEGLGLDVGVIEARSQTWTGNRPVPTTFSKSSDLYDLIYYPAPEDPETVLSRIPKGTVVLNDDDLENADVMGKQYGTVEKIDITDQPFTKGYKITVNDPLPEYPYNFQLRLDIPGKAESGDLMLVKLSMRTLSGGVPESGLGQVQCIVEELTSGTHSKALIGDIMSSSNWTTGYFPYVATGNYIENVQATIRLAYFVQEIEIGGYEVINYGKSIDISDLPATTKYAGQEHDAPWRKEAIDRIEQIRKGDVNIIVKDAAGNAVSGAEVAVNMTEHAFEWGSAVNGRIFNNDENGENYRKAIRENFNAAVLENEHKWRALEETPEKAVDMTEWILKNGLRSVRGHTLVWPSYASDFAVPQDLRDIVAAGDRAAFDKRIEDHVKKTLTEWKGKLSDWDIVNELVANTRFFDAFGMEPVLDWFKWANEIDPDVPKYVSETGIVGVDGVNSVNLNKFIPILDFMKENNVDYDGIAIHAHFGALCNPYLFYEQLDLLATRYDKRLKITEFDLRCQVPEVAAEFIRDILILTFSHENMDGFHMWGFWDGSHWFSNAPLFYKDWTLKPSGKQYQDLVYNKWWTRESGTTAADGSYALRAFYGDYEITVTANGTTKSVAASVEKGADNTITIVLD